ncbi:hypothetical protein [Deinococcus sedimenti]|uniref:Uncharacterized protein n=1 Tax=Deinococcus sedimenti TaxID=1867090 RepID=A0ABQ2S7M0_9DEIO|nr:hypothetical protein [Deinococcus sedimenti]GGS05470.1 hypothetical protein GCM10008960_34950 [Deinococcus sedimenti]
MEDAFPSLSWSAVLVGWPTLYLSVAEVRALAEARLLTASGAALIPMSDLAGLRDGAHRQEGQDALTRLAALEELPVFFARREWLVYLLEQEMARLPEIRDTEEPELTADWRVQALKEFWEANDRPLDLPVINPLIRSYVGLDEQPGGLDLTVDDLRRWILEQRTLLRVVTGLVHAGRQAEVKVIAQAFEAAQFHAAAHLDVVRTELSIHQHHATGRQEPAFWDNVHLANTVTLQHRRARWEQRQTERGQ